MPNTGNLDIYQGDDYVATIMVYDDTGAAADLTGYVIQSQIRLGPADSNSNVVVEVSCTLTPPNQITVDIPHALTTALSGRYMWDLQLTSPSNIVTTIIAGSVTVTEEITREGARAAVMRGHQRPNLFRAVRSVPHPYQRVQ